MHIFSIFFFSPSLLTSFLFIPPQCPPTRPPTCMLNRQCTRAHPSQQRSPQSRCASTTTGIRCAKEVFTHISLSHTHTHTFFHFFLPFSQINTHTYTYIKTDTQVVVTVMVKKLKPEDVKVEFGAKSLSVTAKLHTGSDYK